MNETLEKDPIVANLYLRTRVSGKKAYYLRYTSRQGKRRFPKLGDCPPLTLTDARKMAKKLLYDVALGNDPSGGWIQTRGECTVEDMFKMALEKHWGKPRFKESRRLVEVESLYRNHLSAPFGKMKLTELRPHMIKEWLEGFEFHRPTGNRALEVLSKLFNFAELMEIVGIGTNPCRLVEAFPEQKRDRHATNEELKAIGAVLKRDYKDHTQEVSFLLLLMLTGSRPKALAKVKWTDMELRDGIGVAKLSGKMTLSSGEKETIVFAPPAMRLIKNLEKFDTETILGKGPPRGYWNKIRKELGLEDLWMRDFRRTYASAGLSSGESIGVVGELLNHKSTQTTKVYAKLNDENRLMSAVNISNEVKGILGLGE